MDSFEYRPVVAHFLAGNHVELWAVEGAVPVHDLEEGEADYFRIRSEFAVARLLHQADSSFRVYIRAPQRETEA